MQSSFLTGLPVSMNIPRKLRLVMQSDTFVVPVLAAFLAASEEAGQRWPHQRHHHGKVLLVVQHAVFAGEKEPAALE